MAVADDAIALDDIPMGSPQRRRQIQVGNMGDFRPLFRCVSETLQYRNILYYYRSNANKKSYMLYIERCHFSYLEWHLAPSPARTPRVTGSSEYRAPGTCLLCLYYIVRHCENNFGGPVPKGSPALTNWARRDSQLQLNGTYTTRNVGQCPAWWPPCRI